MKKRMVILVLILAALLSFYIYSSARSIISLPKPEDMAGNEASAFMPREVNGREPAEGSSSLKVSGPVWVEK